MRLSAVLVLMTFLPGAGSPPSPETKGELKLSADEQAILDGTNAERKKAGLAALTADPKLFAAARGHAANMAKQDKLDHTLDGRAFGDRVKAEGFAYARAGENIAFNHATPAEAVAGWMASDGHKANILTAEFTHAGLAVAKSAKGERYWVQVFAAPLGR